MNEARLFLLCPDCHLELKIKSILNGELYFLTSQEAVFDIADTNYRRSIFNFIKNYKISEIIIAIDPSCSLIQSVLNNNKTHKTNTEEILHILYSNYQVELLTEKSIHKRALELSKLNIHLQAELLREIDFINDKIENNEIKLKGMIFEKESKVFSEITLY